MSNKITGVTGQVVTPSERAPAQGREAQAARTTRAPDAEEAVRLTAAARELRAATEALASVPASDAQRVAEVKSAIERGDYRPDPAKIAGELLKMEDQI